VSNAVWTGVPRAALLARVGVRSNDVDAVLEGFDRGEPKSDPKLPGRIPFSRSRPLAKGRRPEVLVAYEMTGQPLPQSHGFPAGAVVPGFDGMSSVKWLTSIQIVTAPYQATGKRPTIAYWDRSSGHPPGSD
jgi:DMSO/TMAO reductase YedYZ molybdopterin-dependent catalytic subunit